MQAAKKQQDAPGGADLSARRGYEALVPRGTPPGALLTTAEVMARTRLGHTMVYGLLRTGDLRSLKVGRRRLIPVEWLEEWLEAQKRAATSGGASRGAGGER